MYKKNSKTILFIDDEELLLHSLEVAFRMLGYSVFTAQDRLDGVNIFKEKLDVIDFIVLDNHMPDSTCQKALQELKDIDPNCKVVIVSGSFSAAEESDFKALGAVDCLSKPFSFDQLVAVFNR